MLMALDPDIAYWCEMAEARDWGDMFAATAEQPGNPMGAHVETPGDGVVFALTALDTFLCNRALGIGVARRAIQSDVDAAVGFVDRLGRTDTAAPLSPHATPPDLRVWFEERGYVPSRNWVKLWHDLRALPTASTDLRIELVGPEWAGDFARISVVEAYGFPPEIAPAVWATMGRPGWRHYLGFDGDAPVSSGAMRIETGSHGWASVQRPRPTAVEEANRRCSLDASGTRATPGAGSRSRRPEKRPRRTRTRATET